VLGQDPTDDWPLRGVRNTSVIRSGSPSRHPQETIGPVVIRRHRIPGKIPSISRVRYRCFAMVDRRLSRPGAIQAWPPGRLCQSFAHELASFRKITARRARVTFRNRKSASFGKIRARPGKTPDQFYLNSYLRRLFNPRTNARSSRETGDLRSIFAAKCHSVDTDLRIRISTGNPPESDNALTRLTIPDGSSFARLEGRERFVLGRPMEGRWQPGETRLGIAGCHQPHEARVQSDREPL
jgi:hypothetical protein